MERLRCARAMGGRIREGTDDLQLLDDRAGPAVADEERQRILVLRADVDEMDVETIDPGDAVRQGVEPRLALPPVVVVQPVLGELLHRLEPYPMRVVFY